MKNSSAGWDYIPAYATKMYIDVYIEPLTYITDKSFKDCVFPSELKLAKVVPIFKSGDSSKITNYRPISVYHFFQKCLKELCIITLTFCINTNLDLDRNTQLKRLS